MSDDDLPRWDDPGFWTGRGCTMLGGAFVALVGAAAAVVFAIADNRNGLVLVIALLRAVLVFLVATKR